MRITPLLLLGLAAGCGGAADNAGADGELPEFNPDAVVYADGCTVVPEARACVEAHPVEFLPGEAPEISSQCNLFGYDCCDTTSWISAFGRCMHRCTPAARVTGPTQSWGATGSE